MAAGTYTVTVTDANNCTKTISATINNTNGPTLSTTQVNVSCNGGANGSIDLTVSGGTSPFTYDWSNDGAESPDNDSQDLSGLTSGTYTVTVTDANSCTATISVTITQPTAITLTETHVNVACYGGSTGSIDATVSGGTSPYTYDWSNDGAESPDNDTQDLSGMSAGTYTVTVSDVASGCTPSATDVVPNYLHVSHVICQSMPHTSCTAPNGAVDITASPTDTYTFLWSNGATTTSISVSLVGSYSAVCTNSCSTSSASTP